jgi:hypothetical protein
VLERIDVLTGDTSQVALLPSDNCSSNRSFQKIVADGGFLYILDVSDYSLPVISLDLSTRTPRRCLLANHAVTHGRCSLAVRGSEVLVATEAKIDSGIVQFLHVFSREDHELTRSVCFRELGAFVDMAIHEKSGDVFVCDQEHSRILVFA